VLSPGNDRRVAALVPATGRYVVQGEQIRAGVELWAAHTTRAVLFADDESRPERAASVYWQLVDRGFRFVLGPYGGDCVRAVAAARPGGLVWNHGGASDDVQRLPGVVSVPSPASRYLVALGRAVAVLRPGASIALVTAAGPFGHFAREGLEREAGALGLSITSRSSFAAAARVVDVVPDAVLACGPLERELALFRSLAPLRSRVILGGVSPGLAVFPSLFGDPDGLLAPVQWHPDAPSRAELGPGSDEVVRSARARDLDLDYVGAQAYAAALVAERCLELSPDDPLAAARALRTATFFGAFDLDASGRQRAHRLSVVRRRGRQAELFLPEAA
jgi:ABC-type branched-subunit amino acid transport system substrate-binding protein